MRADLLSAFGGDQETTTVALMAALVHLVRHGEVHNPDEVVYASLPGFGLSERGRAQAAQAARHLGSQPVVAVWSSPLQRALETAGIIARRFGVPVRTDEDLTEWGLANHWAGTKWADLDDVYPGELTTYLERPDQITFGDETLTSLARRMRSTLERLAARHGDGDIVVVSHQDPLQAARLAFAGKDLGNLNVDKPDHCSIITLRPAQRWSDLGMWTPDS